MSSDTDAGPQGLSAMVDGEVGAKELAQLMRLLASDAQARQRWALYHRLGDVLRAEEALEPGSMPTTDLSVRVMERLRTQEAAFGRRHGRSGLSLHEVAQRAPSGATAANGRWRWAAAVAGLGVTAGLSWWLATAVSSAVPSQLAQGWDAAEPAGAVQVDASGMVRDPRLDALMAAHRQFGGASALQKPAGFLRNATHEPAGQ